MQNLYDCTAVFRGANDQILASSQIPKPPESGITFSGAVSTAFQGLTSDVQALVKKAHVSNGFTSRIFQRKDDHFTVLAR